MSPGEHDVRSFQQSAFANLQLGRSELELRQLIHAVVNDRFRIHFVDKARRGHRVVEPMHGITETAVQLTLIDLVEETQTLAINPYAIMKARCGEKRLHDLHIRIVDVGANFSARDKLSLDDRRSFHKQHPMILRQSRKELLWPLPHPAPTQMTMHDDWKIRPFEKA